MQPVRHPARVRTFHPRRGRMSDRHRAALARLWPAYGLDVAGDPAAVDAVVADAVVADAAAGGHPAVVVDPAALFGRRAPLVLEIGSGMGDATAAMAAADPGRDYLAVDVHTPGLAHLLTLVERRGLANVRVARGDALDLLPRLPAGALDAVHAFFPDPWPKARHHKRRLLQPSHIRLIADRLAPGGTLHVATDWADYAAAALAALTAELRLANTADGYAPRPPYRPVTRYERRALHAGRRVFELVFRRVAGS